MKALLVHDHVFQRWQGEVYSSQFSQRILQRYLAVFDELGVLARSKELDTLPQAPKASGRKIAFHFAPNISSLTSFFGRRLEQEQTIRELLRTHDALIVRLPSEYGLLAAKVARQMGRPYAVELVGCAWDAMWHYGGLFPKLYSGVLSTRVRSCVSHASAVLYVTEEYLQSKYKAGLAATRHFVSNAEIPKPTDDVLERRLSRIMAARSPLRIGTIGSLKTKYKGIHLAIEALSYAHEQGTDFTYHVLGQGDPDPYNRLARKYGLADKIHFDGTLSAGAPIFAWLDNIDIYIQPSLTEGLPRSLIEAMSRGCPAIGSAVGGIPELLGGDTLYKAKRPRELAELVARLCADRDQLQVLAKRNFELAGRYETTILHQKRVTHYQEFRRSLTSIQSSGAGRETEDL